MQFGLRYAIEPVVGGCVGPMIAGKLAFIFRDLELKSEVAVWPTPSAAGLVGGAATWEARRLVRGALAPRRYR
jgi:hypothetical protein